MATIDKIPKCPPLRFPDFNDYWTQCYYKDIFDIIVEKNNNLEFENVVSASLIYGVISRNELGVDIKYSSESIRGYKIVRDGDYIIHLRSFQGGFAFSRLNGICSPAYTILRPKPLYISYGFFEKYFTSSRFINSLKLVTYGIRDGRSIAVDEWMQKVGSLPSLEEQKKIADFLSLIDERITNLSETLKERKREKAGLLNQLFSQKLRFPDYSNEWTTSTISKVCKVATGSMNTQDKVDGGDYPFYVRSSTIERSNRYTYDGIAILTPGDGAIGKIFHYSEGKIAVHQRVYILSEITIDAKYLFYYFSDKFYNRVIRMSAKNTVDSVRINMITDMPLSLPSLAEQKKIADFLSLVDERIEVEEQLLQQYEKQKRYLLKQMFV